MLDAEFIEKSLNINSLKIGHPKNSHIEGFSIDSREISENQCFIAIKGEKLNGHNFIYDCYAKGVRFFIIQKEYKNKIKKLIYNSFIFPVQDTIGSLSTLAKAYKKHIFASSIGITGSAGKTTTRELIGKVLSSKYNIHTAKKNYNNDIGLPLTILQAPPQTHILVLEMGMNHKGEIKRLSEIAEPLVGIITNIGYAHIGMLGSLENTANAKAEIFHGINPHGMALLNRDNNYFQFLKNLSPVEVLDYGLSDITVIEEKGLEGYRLSYKNREFDFQLAGAYNLSNLAAALKAGEIYKINLDEMIQSISSFIPVKGRSEIIRRNFTIIQDSYNANPSSMLLALDILRKANGRRIAVLADMLELGHLSHSLHAMIGKDISENHSADIVLAYGSDSRNVIENIKNTKIEKYFFRSQEELIDKLRNIVQKDDTILVKASHGMRLENTVQALMLL